MAGKVEGITVCASSCMVSGKTTPVNANDVATKSYVDSSAAAAGSTSPQIHFLVVGGGGGGGNNLNSGGGGGGGIWQSSDFLTPGSSNEMYISIGAGGGAGAGTFGRGGYGGNTFFWKGTVSGGGGGATETCFIGTPGAYAGGTRCNAGWRQSSGPFGTAAFSHDAIENIYTQPRRTNRYEINAPTLAWTNPDGSYTISSTSWANQNGPQGMSGFQDTIGSGAGPSSTGLNYSNPDNPLRASINGLFYSGGGGGYGGVTVSANTGNGGYGCGAGGAPGNGGSGIVIIKFDSSITVSVGGGLTSSSISSGGYCTYCFTAGADDISFSGV